MKIDRRNPLHWLSLVAFAAVTVIAFCLRPWRRRRGPVLNVVLYGHKLGGNLLAIYRARDAEPTLSLRVLTLDAPYARELRAAGVDVVYACSWRAVALLADADALVSDHGLHAMGWLPGRCGIRFFDTWHGIPFKGFDADDFRVQHRYDETWVASPMLAKLYEDRFGFPSEKIVVTGYARTDRLVRDIPPRDAVLAEIGVDPAARRVVMFAPTWKQDSAERSLYPFGMSEADFIGRLGALCAETGTVALLRRHLNSGTAGIADRGHAIVDIPYGQFPDTERLLAACDVLVCDWSSIAFDWLLLQRPTLFLDVPPPFAKGFSLGPEFRFGEIVADPDALFANLREFLLDPSQYDLRHGPRSRALVEGLYGGFADGHASERCLQRLLREAR